MLPVMNGRMEGVGQRGREGKWKVVRGEGGRKRERENGRSIWKYPGITGHFFLSDSFQ